ncbi:unnamed protein product [Clonostachys solani]|uniref:Amidase domain-containing protein n=1 Tax=Clonostachys solani TaxID=160281 RepID=A0A9N9ZJY4_9HYPO|nr:unnamed protein product [Clonostachys solani]
MSVVPSALSADNPVTEGDVHDAVAKLGFRVRDDEVDAFRTLLAAAHDTFEELSKLEEYHPPSHPERSPCENVRPGTVDNDLGSPWAYRFKLGPLTSTTTPSSTGTKCGSLLAGKTIVLKDNICVAGIPQSNGTNATPSWIPQMDATVVTRILGAGGRIVGTATCEALSCATVSNTAAVGPIFNPWAKGYSAGGSSSGVAALVGSQKSFDDNGMPVKVDMGLGADQRGSIRVPAAFCGLVGLKATFGLIPYTGVISCEPVLDHVGPMCTSVWDTALLLEAIAGKDGFDDRQMNAHELGEIKYSSNLREWYRKVVNPPGSKPLAGMRLAVITEAIDAPFVDETIKREVADVSKQLESLGASVTEVSIPCHITARSLWMGVCRQSLTSVALGNPHGRRCYYPPGFQATIIPWTQDKWDNLPPGMRNEFINGVYEREKYPNLYQKCMNLTLKVTQEYEKVFKDVDALVLPSVPWTAPKLFDRETATSMDQISSTFGQTLNTMQFNLTGHPAMSIPTGLAKDKTKSSDHLLPLSVQLVARLHGEETLLRIGYAYEKAFDWKSRFCE